MYDERRVAFNQAKIQERRETSIQNLQEIEDEVKLLNLFMDSAQGKVSTQAAPQDDQTIDLHQTIQIQNTMNDSQFPENSFVQFCTNFVNEMDGQEKPTVLEHVQDPKPQEDPPQAALPELQKQIKQLNEKLKEHKELEEKKQKDIID